MKNKKSASVTEYCFNGFATDTHLLSKQTSLCFIFRTAVLGISFGMAFLILSIILIICFIGHFLVGKGIRPNKNMIPLRRRKNGL